MKEKRRLVPHFGRFSLRMLLLAVTILGIWLGLHMRSLNRQRASVEAVRRYGGQVYYDFEMEEDGDFDPRAESAVPKLLLDLLCYDHFHDVVGVNMVYSMETGKLRNNVNQSDEVLGHLSGFPKLEALYLHERQASDRGLKFVGQLRYLRLLRMWDSSEVTDEGVAHLANLPNLEYLILSNAQITDTSLATLSTLPKLEGLSLQGNRFTDDGLWHLRNMTQLRTLVVDLGDNRITDSGLVHLKNLTNLEKLALQSTQVTGKGLRHLAEHKNLNTLYLGGAKVNDHSWLQRQLPECSIHR